MSNEAKKPAETKKTEPKKVYKATLTVNGDSSAITRPNLPTIFDKTTSAVQWLKDNNFKAEDINLIGAKPDCWEAAYPSPEAAKPPIQ
jgi:hypothetical protein